MTEQLSPAGVARTAGPAAGRRATVLARPTVLARAAVVATLESRAAATGTALRRLPAGTTGVEVRADLTGDLDLRELRRHVSGQLVYSLRSQRYGGRSADPPPSRQARLLAAANGYDIVDLEADHDLVPDVLAGIPADRRRISWSGGETDLSGLRRQFDRMVRTPAALYLLAPRAGSLPAALAPLRLLASLGRADVTAFGTGPAAAFSRVLAPWLGAPVVYGSPAGPTVEQLVTDYPLPRLPRLESLYGIVGRSLQTSLFTRLVNAGFRELSLPSLFLPFLAPDLVDFQTRFWPAIAAGSLDELGLPLRALTVAAPYKPAAFATAGLADPPARAAQAANLLLRDGTQERRWRAGTTDGSAMLAALRDTGPVAGVSAAVIGCGAAGRAAAYALSGAGARVTLVNRDASRGRSAAARLGLPFVPLAAFHPGRYAVLVHATPVDDRPPFDLDDTATAATVADFVCAAEPTALVAAARERGLTTVDGQDVVTHEVAQQFQLMTGLPIPTSVHDR
ncbi:MAG: type I 3-dehydroquinate dehydratase [Micromonosporaceae bacterium]|nr:type I 3-dehydroquinate dehydratase [Micromonosporaceae bacterium]